LARDQVGEADAEVEKQASLTRRELAGRQAQLRERAPELVAGTGVVVLELGRAADRRGAADDQLQALSQNIISHPGPPSA